MVLAVGVSLHYIVGSHIIVYETKISAVAQPVRDGVTQKVGSRLQLESRIFSLQPSSLQGFRASVLPQAFPPPIISLLASHRLLSNFLPSIHPANLTCWTLSGERYLVIMQRIEQSDPKHNLKQFNRSWWDNLLFLFGRILVLEAATSWQCC